MKYRTKPGQHGTLYLYRIRYRDADPSCPIFSLSLWAYCEEHAREKFDTGPDEGEWHIVSMARVQDE